MTASPNPPTRAHLLAASRDEVRRLAGQRVSEVTPSRRDFAQYVATQKNGLAVLARFSVPRVATAQLAARARAWDDAEAAALSVDTGPGGLSMSELRVVSDAVTAPILRDALAIDASQLYYARLHGADAVIVPAAELDHAQLDEILTVASSLHMAAVIAVTNAAEVARVVQSPRLILGICCRNANGSLDVPRAQALARDIPTAQTVICIPVVESVKDASGLSGACDAVTLDAASHATADIPRLIRDLSSW